MNRLSVKNFILLTLAGAVNAFGVTFFLAPVKLYDSGISGTSMLLSQITPEWMSLSLFLLILNIPLFLYGLKRQGNDRNLFYRKPFPSRQNEEHRSRIRPESIYHDIRDRKRVQLERR